MHRRLSSAEKGKAPALEYRPAPRVGRVRVSEPTIQSNLHDHSLTLIGRITNPSTQKVWSLIPFFTDHWKADIPPVGTDLGMGMFKFQFELESDLLTVLEKRPYHYARWMVILQRWEPTISPTFPSMIPFWIKIQGLSIHLWTEEVARKFGEDLGTFEVADITSQTIRMRVHVNGRLPIIKSSIVEYPNGDEVAVTLLYEKLEKHCQHCGKLDHEIRDCLEAKHQKKAHLAAQEESQRSKTSAMIKRDPPQEEREAIGGFRRLSPRREHRYNPYSRNTQPHRSQNPSYQHSSQARRNPQWSERGRERSSKDREDPDYYHRGGSRNDEKSYYRRGSPPRRERYNFSGVSHTAQSPAARKGRDDLEWISTQNIPRGDRDQTMERGSPLLDGHDLLPVVAMENARGEVREVMRQYTSCADPSESAARKERLRQAEDQGQLEDSAAQIVRASLARQSLDTTASA